MRRTNSNANRSGSKQREFLNPRSPKQCLIPPNQNAPFDPFPLFSLPLELIPEHILSYLGELRHLARFAQTSKTSAELCLNNLLWKSFFYRDFSPQYLARSLGSRVVQMKKINRFGLPWKEYYYFMCTKSNNPDLAWENLRKLPPKEREDHIQDILHLTDTRFHKIKWQSTVEEIVLIHNHQNQWSPFIHAATYLPDGTAVRVEAPNSTYPAWFHVLPGDVLETEGTVISPNPLTILSAQNFHPPPQIRKSPSLLDIKWSGWILAFFIFLLPLIFKCSNLLFSKWLDPTVPPNATEPVINSPTRGFFNTTSKEWEYPNATITHEIPSHHYTNHFIQFVEVIERPTWAGLTIFALWRNFKIWQKGLMPLLFLAFIPLPWPFHWLVRLNNYTCSQTFMASYAFGLVLQGLFPGSYTTNFARLLLCGILLGLSLRFRVRVPEVAFITIGIFVVYVLLLNLHYVWWGTLKQAFLAGIVAGYVHLVAPKFFPYDYRKQDISGLALAVVLLLLGGGYYVLWVIFKWFLYSLPVLMTSVTLPFMYDIDKIV